VAPCLENEWIKRRAAAWLDSTGCDCIAAFSDTRRALVPCDAGVPVMHVDDTPIKQSTGRTAPRNPKNQQRTNSTGRCMAHTYHAATQVQKEDTRGCPRCSYARVEHCCVPGRSFFHKISISSTRLTTARWVNTLQAAPDPGKAREGRANRRPKLVAALEIGKGRDARGYGHFP